MAEEDEGAIGADWAMGAGGAMGSEGVMSLFPWCPNHLTLNI